MPNRWTVLSADRLFDGTGRPPISGGVVVIRDEEITEVGVRGKVGEPASARTVHFEAATILPGLIDAHTHLIMPGDGSPGEEVMKCSDGILLLRAVDNAQRALEAGITTLADTGARNQVTFVLREAIRMGLGTGPRLVLCGRPLTRTGGHCWFLGGEADGPDGIRSAARQLLREGADIIKVMATGGGTIGTDPYRPSYRPRELAVAVAEAHDAGKRAIAHCSATEGISRALEASFDVIFHAHFRQPDGQLEFQPEVAARLVDSGAYVNPTLEVNRVLAETLRSRAAELTPAEEAVLAEREDRYAGQCENVARLVQLGVKMVAGSDAGWGYVDFDGLLRELDAMLTVGMSAQEVLLAATRNAADALGVSSEVGTLEAGKKADILVVAGDPTSDLATLRNVKAVMLGGRFVKGEAA